MMIVARVFAALLFVLPLAALADEPPTEAADAATRLAPVQVSSGHRIGTLRQVAAASRRFEKIPTARRSHVRLAWRLACDDEAACASLALWVESATQRRELQRDGIHVLFDDIDATGWKDAVVYAERELAGIELLPDVRLVLPEDGALTAGYLREGFQQVWTATKKVNRLWVAALMSPDTIRFYFAEPQAVQVRDSAGKTLWSASAARQVSLCVARLERFPDGAEVRWPTPPQRIGGAVGAGPGADCNDGRDNGG